MTDTNNTYTMHDVEFFLSLPGRHLRDCLHLQDRIEEMDARLTSVSMRYSDDPVCENVSVSNADVICSKVMLEERWRTAYGKYSESCASIMYGLGLAGVSEQDAQIAHLRWCECRSVHEVADLMGISDRTVFNASKRVRGALLRTAQTTEEVSAYEQS